jgi:peptide/nickel transport system substrate-binding protein
MSKDGTKLNRRTFLYTSAMTTAGIALAACAKPAATPAPAPVVAQPTQPPAAVANTPVPTKAPPTAVPQREAEREAPMLAEMVAKGELPPLADRLPKVPLVLQPLEGTGVYGGTIRTFHSTLGNAMEEWMYGASPLRWVDDGLGIAAGMCDWWETNADNSEWTVHIREGLKWSDGEPCTVDDVLFWWNDLVRNADHPDQPPDFGQGGGKLAEFIKVDDYTLKIKYVASAPLTEKRLAMWVNSAVGPRWIAPKHYLQQFHPTYNKAVTTFEEMGQKILERQNPDCPTLRSWKPEVYEAGLRRRWVRNPYYYCVDTEGNQLPYVDYIDERQIGDKEVQMLTIRQGDVDYLAHVNHMGGLADIAPLLDTQASGKYEVILLDGGGGSGHYYFCNYDAPDEKWRWLCRNPKFKAAWLHCMDRPQLQRVNYYGTGELTSGTHSPKCLEFNFNEEARGWYAKERDSYIAFDVEKAKQLLDEIGLVDVDGDGYREYPDGSRMEIKIDLPSDTGQAWRDGHEIVKPSLDAAGLRTILNEIPPAEFGAAFWQVGQGFIRGGWGIGDGPDHLVYPSWLVPNEPARWAPLCGIRYQQLGTEREDTETDKSPWDRTPPRWASTDQEFQKVRVSFPGMTPEEWRDAPVPKMQDILTEALAEPDAIRRMEMVWDLLQIHIDEGKFGMGSVANTPNIYIRGNSLMNVPRRGDTPLNGFCGPWIVPHPAIHNTETFSFKADAL